MTTITTFACCQLLHAC